MHNVPPIRNKTQPHDPYGLTDRKDNFRSVYSLTIASHYNCISLPERRVNGLTIRTVCTDRKGTFRFVYGPYRI